MLDGYEDDMERTPPRQTTPASYYLGLVAKPGHTSPRPGSPGLNSAEDVSGTLSSTLPELQSSGDKEMLLFPRYSAEPAMDEDIINETAANELLEVLTTRRIGIFYSLIVSSIPIYFADSMQNSGQEVNDKSLALGVVSVV
jgi:hypothetical protein